MSLKVFHCKFMLIGATYIYLKKYFFCKNENNIYSKDDHLVQCKMNSSHVTQTYVKVLSPHPAARVNSRGPRSRAGLMAYPQLRWQVMPITNTDRPTQIGTRPLLGFMFRSSVMAITQIRSIAVPNIWIKNLNVLVIRVLQVVKHLNKSEFILNIGLRVQLTNLKVKTFKIDFILAIGIKSYLMFYKTHCKRTALYSGLSI